MLVIFWPAGTILWPEAWIYIIIQISFSAFTVIYFLERNPEIIKKRMDLRMPKELWDKIILPPFMIAMTLLLIVPGLDVKRYNWSSIPICIEILGFIGILISLYLLFTVLKTNSYLLITVEIQKKQKVVSKGPYKYVRHPMYLATILMSFSIALALGSLYTLIPAGIASLLLIIRTNFEDNTLKKELKGYKAYTKKTKYKLIPGIW
jgi:protein-S-isoprenylcysteine O-methyltransferase Ste14